MDGGTDGVAGFARGHSSVAPERMAFRGVFVCAFLLANFIVFREVPPFVTNVRVSGGRDSRGRMPAF